MQGQIKLKGVWENVKIYNGGGNEGCKNMNRGGAGNLKA